MHQSTSKARQQPTQHDEVKVPAVGLSDEELTARGLVKIHAFTRATSSLTNNATRAKRARLKAAASGTQQLNVVAPLLVHPALRVIANDLREGSPLADVLLNALTSELRNTHPSAEVRVTTSQEKIEAKAVRKRMNPFAALRAWLIRVCKM